MTLDEKLHSASEQARTLVQDLEIHRCGRVALGR